MRSLVALGLCLAMAGCGGAAVTPERSAIPTKAASGSRSGHGEAVEGPFRLAFEMPKTTWTTMEAIDGAATLKLAQERVVELGGSGGGLVAFEFTQLGTTRRVEPVWTADCVSRQLRSGEPIVSAIHKSGGFSPEQEDAGFYEAFFADPLVHLPAGQWEVTAIASFVEGQRCDGTSHWMRASVVIDVVP